MTTWVECSKIYLPYYSPGEEKIIYSNSVDGNDPNGPPDTWITVNLPLDSPPNCKGIHLTGIIIITSGSVDMAETADIHIRFRSYLGGQANGYLPNYVGQACEARYGGVRSPMSAFIHVVDNKFEYYWTRSTPPPWPQHASYGFVFYADALLA